MATISLTGLNFFKIETDTIPFAPDLKDINGNVFKLVTIEANSNNGEIALEIVLPEISSLNYTLDTKLVIVLSEDNSNRVYVNRNGSDTINGNSSAEFSFSALRGSSMTITPVDATNWSAVITETLD